MPDRPQRPSASDSSRPSDPLDADPVGPDPVGHDPIGHDPLKTPEKQLAVAIIGAGPLGRWLAARAACSGMAVYLEDVLPGNLHHAREYVRQRLSAASLDLQANGSLHCVSTVEDAVREADLAIDCVPDELESKLEILWLLDRMAPPRTVFATPTAALEISDLAACTYRPERCIAIAAAPAALADLEQQNGAAIPLRAGPATSAETVAMMVEFWRRMGFTAAVDNERGFETPIHPSRPGSDDSPGNRDS